ncbi:uncharacterized protein KY384_005821 [Bacidia gigantensis]|uniref:uncharacterized protein n=1 Tax=Bacidia gigantensis TaxID=2732470 RepID=UPI001D04BAFD|nr:uncharacterized protein KY384_005821 [Bacidia gigantensis]KAG8529186.1 hypothetical protein KY384_005821 [Bacidia gigantensis]
MYDDASYYYPSHNASPSRQQPTKVKHKRRQSLLEKPAVNEGTQADGRLDGPGLGSVKEVGQLGPPEATLKKRAQSYTDFHYAATAILRQDLKHEVRLSNPRTSKDDQDISTEDPEELHNDLDFADQLHASEGMLLESSHENYSQYLRQLVASESHLEGLLAETSSSLDLLDDLSNSFKAVEAQTSTFQKQCEGLLEEQKRIETLANEIDQNLKYYNYLEPATRRLNAPGAGSLVRSEEFSEMLTRIDHCLDFMAAHPKHKEAATYRSHYRLLMTRGLTLIRVNFINGLRDIASDVSRRIADKQLNDTTMSALLYAKFRVGAAELKEVAQEIRKRAILPASVQAGGESEYQGLMNELYTSYSATRGKLVIPLARKRIGDIAMAPSTSKDLVSFARSAIGYTKGVCSDEYDLWREWFVGEEGMYDFLESVCEPLHDHLRPRIIHEVQLLKLAELCTLLQMRYMHDQDEDAEPLEANQLDFSVLIRPALEDAQTRLVFRTQSILRDEIERYKPKKEELDYPTRNRQVSLSGTKSQKTPTSGRKASNPEPSTPMPKTPMIVEEGDSPTGRWNFDTEAAFQGWYPTLRKAIWLLSRIYRLVNSTVFDDLAHTIVFTTVHSLLSASQSISSLTHRTPSDGRLFLIKHLLILKSQIVAFDIEYVTPDIAFDFSNLTNTFYELRERGGLFDPRNWFRLVREGLVGGGLLPKVVENMFDAKVELDGRLRSVINEFTAGFANAITAPINASALASPRFDAMAAVGKIQEIAGKEVPTLRRKLDEYLDENRTKETLVAAVQEMVVGNYEGFYDEIMREKEKAGNQGGRKSKKGKGRDDEVWDVDMFSEWANGVFDVKGIDGFEGGSIRGGSAWGRPTSYNGSVYSR